MSAANNTSPLPLRSEGFSTILTIVVFTTGFTALLYQVVWQRLLGLFSGSDVRSATIVTSAFLAGLGLGSFIGSFFADRLTSRQAVRIYGLCNLGIAAFALASRFIYYDLLYLELQDLAESPALLLLVVFASLLIPTTLMGLSLPLLSKAVVRSVQNAPHLITWLYGFNTLGAGIGTFASGWYIVGSYGYERTAQLGALLSAFVGVTALLISASFSTAQIGTPERPFLGLRFKTVPRSVWTWCLLVFASGFIAISLEVIWFRVLDVVLKSNAYTFAHLLSFFLIGDAFGSLVGANWVNRVQNPRRTFLWLQGGIALYSILSILLISLTTDHYPLHTYIIETGSRLEFTLTNNRLQWLVYLALPAMILLPPSFLIGFYFPIVQKGVQTDTATVGQRVGLVEVSNILGNTLGGIITGLVLLHYLGTAASLRLIALLGLGFALVLLWENFSAFFQKQRWLAGSLAAGLLLAIFLFPSNTTLWARFHAVPEEEWFAVAEDSTGVSAIRQNDTQGLLLANGRVQGFIPYSTTHSFLGVLPALMHADPQEILVIGIGSSGTPYTVGLNPGTKTIYAVEIVSSEIDVLETFAEARNVAVLNKFLNDPRYEIILGDGRHVLAFSDRKYDIIEADAILPISSHSGLLYSKEYFQSAYEQLAPGGIMAQWMPTPLTQSTFMAVFPYGAVIDSYILGSNQPIEYDPQALLAKLDDPAIQSYLMAGGVDIEALREKLQPASLTWTPETRPATFLASQLNTDLFPRDEYYLNN